MPHWIIQPWQRNLSKIASGKPGAVQGRCRIGTLGDVALGAVLPYPSSVPKLPNYALLPQRKINDCLPFSALIEPAVETLTASDLRLCQAIPGR